MVEKFVEIGAMIDLPELPFIDTMMTTIVFYGHDRKLPAREARVLIENICGLLNEVPSHAHVGLGEGRKSRGPKFRALDKLIAKGDFEYYSYIEAVNYFEKGNVRDCSLAVCVSEQSERRHFYVHFRRDRNAKVDTNLILQEVVRHISPLYGILYDLTVREGPLWFIRGQWSSGMPDALGRSSSEFQQEYLFGKKFADGFFRDVFKWNYLCKAHLDKQIDGMRFRDWIELPQNRISWFGKTKTRGTLSILENGNAVWELTNEEMNEVRAPMLKENLLMVKS